MQGREDYAVAWTIELVDDCAVVIMNTNKVNVQNDSFFADLHDAFDRLEREFNPYPIVLTGQGDIFSAGIDFQYSFNIFGSGVATKSASGIAATALQIFESFSIPGQPSQR